MQVWGLPPETALASATPTEHLERVPVACPPNIEMLWRTTGWAIIHSKSVVCCEFALVRIGPIGHCSVGTTPSRVAISLLNVKNAHQEGVHLPSKKRC